MLYEMYIAYAELLLFYSVMFNIGLFLLYRVESRLSESRREALKRVYARREEEYNELLKGLELDE